MIRVETMISRFELLRGMMFRTSLASDRGMLFVEPKAGQYSYWMYQTLIPLDIIWLDSNRNIVEIVRECAALQNSGQQCPQYGGNRISSYVIEIPDGMAKKFGLQVGQQLQW